MLMKKYDNGGFRESLKIVKKKLWKYIINMAL